MSIPGSPEECVGRKLVVDGRRLLITGAHYSLFAGVHFGLEPIWRLRFKEIADLLRPGSKSQTFAYRYADHEVITPWNQEWHDGGVRWI